jgi:DNA adenine methylase
MNDRTSLSSARLRDQASVLTLVAADQRIESSAIGYLPKVARIRSLFFALRPRSAILSDVNVDLINTYRQVKYHARELVERLMLLPVDRETYLRIRAGEPSARIDRAVRFLYLNRTAFGGIYRLNLQGRFNVPFGGGGRSPSILWEKDLLRLAARALRRTELIAGDFQSVLREAGPGDLIYCDPTYTVSHSNNGFIRYNESNFRWDDQKRLADLCRELQGRGATVLVSNAAHHAVGAVFDRCEVHTFSRPSTVCPRLNGRRVVREHVFVFRPTSLRPTSQVGRGVENSTLSRTEGSTNTTPRLEISPDLSR